MMLLRMVMTVVLLGFGAADEDSYTRCIASTGEGCNARESTFLEKMRGKSDDEIKAQKLRLRKMDKGQMKEELADWINRRLRICKQLSPDTAQVAATAL